MLMLYRGKGDLRSISGRKKQVQAQLIGMDANSDVAVVKVDKRMLKMLKQNCSCQTGRFR